MRDKEMKTEKVIEELRERMADPMQKKLADKLKTRIKQVQEGDKNILGTTILELLEMAEKGEFKEEVKE